MEITTGRSTLKLENHGNNTAGVMDDVPIGVKTVQTKRRVIKTRPVSRLAWKEAMITASDMDREKIE